MNATTILKKYKLDKVTSIHTAIRDISERIDSAKDPHVTSNQIIVDLGGSPLQNPIDAGLLARCLIERAFYSRDAYNPESAVKSSMEKVSIITDRMPYLYKSQLNTSSNSTTDKPKRTNDKKQQALRIYMENLDKKNKEIVQLIVKEMSITESNASYYIQQFKKASK